MEMDEAKMIWRWTMQHDGTWRAEKHDGQAVVALSAGTEDELLRRINARDAYRAASGFTDRPRAWPPLRTKR